MMGCRNGVVACIKEIMPSAIGVDCAAHRLNLASTQAGDSIPYIKNSTILSASCSIFLTIVLCELQA